MSFGSKFFSIIQTWSTFYDHPFYIIKVSNKTCQMVPYTINESIDINPIKKISSW